MLNPIKKEYVNFYTLKTAIEIYCYVLKFNGIENNQLNIDTHVRLGYIFIKFIKIFCL